MARTDRLSPVLHGRPARRIGAWAIGASAGAHGLLFALWLVAAAPTPGHAPPAGLQPVQIRMVGIEPVPVGSESLGPEPLRDTVTAGLPVAAFAAGADPVPAPTSADPAAPVDAAVALAAPLAMDDPVAAAGYLPRRALTRVPRPLTEPIVSAPAGHGDGGEQRGVFSLFISAEGGVDAVVPDGPTLAPPLEEAARRVLMGTRFSAGEVDGRAVGALIRIEIVFENQLPAASPVPVVVSQQPL